MSSSKSLLGLDPVSFYLERDQRSTRSDSLSILNDDVLMLVIDHLHTPADVVRFSSTARRMAELAKTNLLYRRYGDFVIEPTSRPKDSVYFIRDLLHLIANPSLVQYVRCITLNTYAKHYWTMYKDAQESICPSIVDLQRHSKCLTGKTRHILRSLKKSITNSVDNLSKSQKLLDEVVISLWWLCPNVTELRMMASWKGRVIFQLGHIAQRICLQQDDDLALIELQPFIRDPDYFELRWLKLSFFTCDDMQAQPESFDLLAMKSLRRIEIINFYTFRRSTKSNIPADTQCDRFWPLNYRYDCHARQIVIEVHRILASPLVIADWLSRCPSLRRFDLLGYQQAGDQTKLHSHGEVCSSLEFYVEWFDGLADIMLQTIRRGNTKGIPGYADLIRTALGSVFESRRWKIRCFVPCDRPEHRRWVPPCACVVIRIETDD